MKFYFYKSLLTSQGRFYSQKISPNLRKKRSFFSCQARKCKLDLCLYVKGFRVLIFCLFYFSFKMFSGLQIQWLYYCAHFTIANDIRFYNCKNRHLELQIQDQRLYILKINNFKIVTLLFNPGRKAPLYTKLTLMDCGIGNTNLLGSDYWDMIAFT